MLDRTKKEPLYLQLKQELADAMLRGEIAIGDKLMSENELMRYYGVGRMTVRSALSELVSEGCVKKEHGLGSFCVGYPGDRKLNIDVLLDSRDTYFTPYLLTGISQVLEQNNCNLLLHDTRQSQQQVLELLEEILRRGTDGVLLEPLFGHEEPSPALTALLEQLLQKGIPLVSLLTSIPDIVCPALVVDEMSGAELATQYLLDCGHRRLLGVFYEPIHNTSNRMEGFTRVVSRYPDVQAFLLTEPDPQGCHFLDLVRRESITAVQCYNDQVAVTCLRLLVEHGYQVPEQISLIGFDDTDLSINAIPRLTTLSHPKDRLGNEAARLILRMIREKNFTPEHVIYRPGLVIRQSVKSLSQKS